MRELRPLARLLLVVLLAANGIANFAHRHGGMTTGDLRRASIEPSGGSARLPEQPPSCLACQYLGSASLTVSTAPAVAAPAFARPAALPLPDLPHRRCLLGIASPRGPPLDGSPHFCCTIE